MGRMEAVASRTGAGWSSGSCNTEQFTSERSLKTCPPFRASRTQTPVSEQIFVIGFSSQSIASCCFQPAHAWPATLRAATPPVHSHRPAMPRQAVAKPVRSRACGCFRCRTGKRRRHRPLPRARGLSGRGTRGQTRTGLSPSGMRSKRAAGMASSPPHNMGVIRHVAVNLLKRESTKISVRKKRIRAALNDGFRDKVLMGQ